jgi:hypothetical protein
MLSLSICLFSSLLSPPPGIDRRTFLSGSFYSERIHKLSSGLVPKPNINPDDNYAHWSFFGLAPPPIEKTITYKELLNEIKNKNILTLQTATQHDIVVATTVNGHRLASPMNDEDFSIFVLKFMDKDGNLPFIVLPYDQVRGGVRNVAQYCAIVFSSFVGLDQFNLLPWQISSFSSIKERDEFISKGKRPKKLIDYVKDLIDNSKQK